MKNKVVGISNLILIYSFMFLVIYTPPIELYTSFSTFSILLIIIPVFAIKFYPFIIKFLKNKYILIFYLSFILATFYYYIRSIPNGHFGFDTNAMLFIQTFYLGVIFYYLDEKGFGFEGKLKILLNLAIVQFIVVALMLLFPSFRIIARDMYDYLTSGKSPAGPHRIFGFMSDYTYSTPIYHGMLASIALYMSQMYSMKYYYYIPPILLIILLNGRTGLIVFILNLIIVLVFLAINEKDYKKTLSKLLFFILFLSIIIYLIYKVSPYTFLWLKRGLNEFRGLFNKDFKAGTIKVLFNDMLYFPKEWNFIFGKGHRVYGEYGKILGYFPSDIGYVNDFFKGGLLYVAILYFGVSKFILSDCFKYNSKSKIAFTNRNITVLALITLIIGNFKGEAMRSGTILLGIFMVKVILQIEINNEKRKNYEKINSNNTSI